LAKVTCITSEISDQTHPACAISPQSAGDETSATIASVLLNKLLEIERMIGRMDEMTIRAKVMDAQTDVLRVQAETIRLLEENGRLQVDYDRWTHSALSPVSARSGDGLELTQLVERTA